jgi:hypothetical protein
MERIEELIQNFINSEDIESQELASKILTSDTISIENKLKYLGEIAKKHSSGKINLFTEEFKNVFENWNELNKQTIKEQIKKRVNKL